MDIEKPVFSGDARLLRNRNWMIRKGFLGPTDILLKSSAERHKCVNGAWFLRVEGRNIHRLFHNEVEKLRDRRAYV